MARIKNWKKSKKYDGTNLQKFTIWSNTLPEYRDFQDHYYVSISGEPGLYYFNEVKNGYNTTLGTFPNYKEAERVAINYMKAHPRG